MKRPPTDLEVLEEIYKRYYSTFISFSKEKPSRSAKVYVPVDVEAIAKHFAVDPDIIFGRLYYHLESKYGFTQPDGKKVSFFRFDERTIQFPLLAAVIASLREERDKHLSIIKLTISAIIISFAAVIFTLVFNIWDKWDYKEQIASNVYEKLYNDVAQGRYGGTKLKDAIKTIKEHGDDLSGMNLSKKWLDGINLKGENLYAVNFSESIFYSIDESTKIEKLSDFSGANLRKANLTGANLQGANLEGANLKKANLEEANLEGTKGLTYYQLVYAKTLYKAKLDSELMNQVKKHSSYLLEKPKPYE
ncbi:MAG: pentapeptide repeat-containing protein [Thermodesulfobacteriota bacterium]